MNLGEWLRVLITSQKGKQNLVQAFEKAGAEVVKEFPADLIIPTVDEELPFMSILQKELNIPIMVASENTIYHCRDKAEFNLFCKRHAFQTPRTWHMNGIVKPRFGKGGKDIKIFDYSYIMQEYCEFPEVSIDYFADWEGKCLSVIPRYRKEVVKGESKDMEIVADFDFREVKRLGKELKLIGHNVIQGYWTGEVFIFGEVNPRFGGGSHLTFGLWNSPKWLIENL